MASYRVLHHQHAYRKLMQGPRQSLEELARLVRAVLGELPAMTGPIDGLRDTGYQVPIFSSNPRSFSDALDMAGRIEAQCRRRTAATVMTIDVAGHLLGSPRTGTLGSRRNNSTNPRS